MGSGLVQAYIATWGALIEEKTLTADTALIQISNIPGTWKYLHIFLNVISDQVAGPVPYSMQVSDGAATYYGTYSTQDPPATLAVVNYNGTPAWVCAPMGDNTQNCFSEWVITQDPAITIKNAFVRSVYVMGSSIYTSTTQVILPAGETYINTVKIYPDVLGVKFRSGSKMAIYGLN